MPARAADAVGVPVAGRVAHVAEGADRRVLADPPAREARVPTARVGEVDGLAEDVREHLVERARLVVVEEPGLVVEHAVRELVGDDVVRLRPAAAEDRLLVGPVPLPVVPGARRRERAVADRGLHPRAATVDPVAAEARAIPGLDDPHQPIGGVDVGDRPTAAGLLSACTASCTDGRHAAGSGCRTRDARCPRRSGIAATIWPPWASTSMSRRSARTARRRGDRRLHAPDEPRTTGPRAPSFEAASPRRRAS